MPIHALGPILAGTLGAGAPTALATGVGTGLAAGAGAGAGTGLGLGVFGPIAPSMAASAPFAVPEAAGLLQAMGSGSKLAEAQGLLNTMDTVSKATEIPQITNPLSSIMSDPTYEMLKDMMQQQAQNQPSQKLSPMQLASSPQVQIPQVNLMQLLSQIGGR